MQAIEFHSCSLQQQEQTMISCALCARCKATVRVSLPSGIEPLTFVPAGLAHDHKTREES